MWCVQSREKVYWCGVCQPTRCVKRESVLMWCVPTNTVLNWCGVCQPTRCSTDVVCANQHGAQYSQVELVNTKTRNVEGLLKSHSYGNLPNPIFSKFLQNKKVLNENKSDHLQGKADTERCDDLCSTTDLSVHGFVIQTSSLSLSLSLSLSHTRARTIFLSPMIIGFGTHFFQWSIMSKYASHGRWFDKKCFCIQCDFYACML